MGITSKRTVVVELSGDVTEGLIQSALDNITAIGKSELVSLAIGNNTITAPVVTAFVNTGLVIIPPTGNATIITLKGVAGDTGIPLHLTDPVSLSLDPTFVSLVLSVPVAVVGVRLVWS